MNESPTVSLACVISATLWFLTFATLVAAWVLMGLGEVRPAVTAGLTAGVLAPAAGLATARCYFARLSALVRLATGLERPEPAPAINGHSLHPIRP